MLQGCTRGVQTMFQIQGETWKYKNREKDGSRALLSAIPSFPKSAIADSERLCRVQEGVGS